jgi:hypothetical protein
MRVPEAFAAAEPLSPMLGIIAFDVLGAGWTIIERCTVTKQEKSEWCWASVTQAVDRFYRGGQRSQCDFARGLLGTGSCGSNCTSKTCNSAQPLEHALDLSRLLREPPVGLVDFTDIRREITAQAPVCVHIDRAKGHFLVIVGFAESPNRLAILDPDRNTPGSPQSEGFESFRDFGYSLGGSWDDTYLTADTA